MDDNSQSEPTEIRRTDSLFYIWNETFHTRQYTEVKKACQVFGQSLKVKVNLLTE